MRPSPETLAELELAQATVQPGLGGNPMKEIIERMEARAEEGVLSEDGRAILTALKAGQAAADAQRAYDALDDDDDCDTFHDALYPALAEVRATSAALLAAFEATP